MEIVYTKEAIEDLQFWQKNDKRKISKIESLIDAIIENPYKGIGKPEPLKFNFAGKWSRRITDEDRLVYRIEGNEKLILYSLRGHYI